MNDNKQVESARARRSSAPWAAMVLVAVGILSFARIPGDEVPKGALSIEEGFVEVSLPITEVKKQADGTVTVLAQGEAEGSVAGLIVDIPPKWIRDRAAELGLTLYWGKAT